jgi:hypothetical protein
MVGKVSPNSKRNQRKLGNITVPMKMRQLLTAAVLIWLPGTLTTSAQLAPRPTKDIEPYLGLLFTDVERDSLEGNLKNYMESYELLHAFSLSNAIPPALYFNPEPEGFSESSFKSNCGLASCCPAR